MQDARRGTTLLGLAIMAIVSAPSLGPVRAHDATECQTEVKPYAVALTGDYAVRPLLSVGDRVRHTGDPSRQYQMVGIPDGLGAHRGRRGQTVLYMNHELNKGTLTEPVVGGPLNRGAFVSRYVLGGNACVVSGKRAYDRIYLENDLLGPAPEVGNTTPDFGRFCSGSLAWEEAGFDRPIYFAGEESGGAATFDGRGGQAVAVFDNKLHTLPKLGHFPWENTLAQPKAGRQTVLLLMEDGPASPDSQLYMYVGHKDRRPGRSALSRNGLDNGKLYVFVSSVPGATSEVTFQSGTITGTWREIPNAEFLSEAELEVASDALGA